MLFVQQCRQTASELHYQWYLELVNLYRIRGAALMALYICIAVTATSYTLQGRRQKFWQRVSRILVNIKWVVPREAWEFFWLHASNFTAFM